MHAPARLALLLLLVFHQVLAQAQAGAPAEALVRLVHQHDPSIFVATGALYLKQEAVRAAGGRPLPPALLGEVDRLLDQEVRGDPAWFYDGLAAAIGPRLSAEAADEIASHFDTDVGRRQRRTVEQVLGEVLMNIYTFTNRIDYRIPESAAELAALQAAVGPHRGTCNCPTPWEREHPQPVAANAQPTGTEDLSHDPAAVRFASGGAGVAYVKILMIQGLESMTSHFEDTARRLRALVRAGMATP